MQRPLDRSDAELVLLTAKQIASSLVQQLAAARGLSQEQLLRWRIPQALIHFHDASTTPIAWNDVQALGYYNEYTGENVPVPAVPTQGYNQHHHRSEYDGGLIDVAGVGIHDHRDNSGNGAGFAFSIWAPGTLLPQVSYAL